MPRSGRARRAPHADFQPSASQGSGGRISHRRPPPHGAHGAGDGRGDGQARRERLADPADRRGRAERGRRPGGERDADVRGGAPPAQRRAEVPAAAGPAEAREERRRRKGSKPRADGAAGGDDLELFASPSALWGGLTTPARAAVSVAGFLAIYYLLFVQHRRWDVPAGAGAAGPGAAPSPVRDGRPARPPPIWHQEVLGALAAASAPDRGADRVPPDAAPAGAHGSGERSARRPVPAVVPAPPAPAPALPATPGPAPSREQRGEEVHETASTPGTRAPSTTATAATTVTANPVSDADEQVPSPFPSPSPPPSPSPSSSDAEAVPARPMQRPAFKNVDPDVVPAGEIPVLHWNYNRVADAGTSRQYFALANHDHVAAFKPLCMNPATNKVVTVAEPRFCGGYNRTAGWMVQYCKSVEDSYDRESNMESDDTPGDAWLRAQEAAGRVEWIDGLTVLQVYEKSCGNIAHFAGRATMLQHVLDNINAYAAAPSEVENVLIVPTFHIMKRFLYPHNYEYWHKNFLRAIVAPSSYTIGTLGNFLYRAAKHPYAGVPRTQLLHNFSLAGSNVGEDKVVCFRRAVVPGYFKDRYFADDREYPSEKPSLQSALPRTPRIPRDALRLRERVSALIHKTPRYKVMAKRVVYLDRVGGRRRISEQGKAALFQALEAAATARHFTFNVISFDGRTFKEQVAVMENASIAVGVHGANLVNTMFMPPLAVLVELFPFNFHHGMYVEGGGAGLQYFSHAMLTGELFPGGHQYHSADECIKLNSACKVHYRDAELRVTDDDVGAIVRVFDRALDWNAAVVKQGGGGKRRRRRRRRRARK